MMRVLAVSSGVLALVVYTLSMGLVAYLEATEDEGRKTSWVLNRL